MMILLIANDDTDERNLFRQCWEVVVAAVCGLVESVGSGSLGLYRSSLGLGILGFVEIKIMQHLELGIRILIWFDLGLVWSGILGFVEIMLKLWSSSIWDLQLNLIWFGIRLERHPWVCRNYDQAASKVSFPNPIPIQSARGLGKLNLDARLFMINACTYPEIPGNTRA